MNPEAHQTTGVILLNLGTPDAADTASVRRYLREFLSDPRVIDLPGLARWLLLNLVILPFRPKQSASAYQEIWTEQGSPLLTISQAQVSAVQQQLGNDYKVVLGMRYGNPSISSALQQLLDYGCDHIIALPLFPQYSSAASGSAIEKLLEQTQSLWNIPKLTICGDFYDHPGFIQAYAELIQQQNVTPDKIIFSYHGLPVRHISKSEQAICDQDQPCPAINTDNRFCYRAQCYATSKAIAKQLGLAETDYITTFQSRLGRTPWIKPFTDQTLPELKQQGCEKIMVVCPSFVTDCLETLEEIGIRAKQEWQALGGEALYLVPCLNTSKTWINAICTLINGDSNACI